MSSVPLWFNPRRNYPLEIAKSLGGQATKESLVLGLLAALVALLIQGKLRPALLFSGAVLITYLSGLADINAVVAGYTNSALLTLVLLLLVSLAVEKTRIMSWFANLVGTGSFNKVLVKVWFSTAFLSAFVTTPPWWPPCWGRSSATLTMPPPGCCYPCASPPPSAAC